MPPATPPATSSLNSDASDPDISIAPNGGARRVQRNETPDASATPGADAGAGSADATIPDTGAAPGNDPGVTRDARTMSPDTGQTEPAPTIRRSRRRHRGAARETAPADGPATGGSGGQDIQQPGTVD